jgi:hypothetical protein
MVTGKNYDFDEAVDLLIEPLSRRKGRPRGQPFLKKSAIPPGPAALPPDPSPDAKFLPALPRWLPQFRQPPMPGRDYCTRTYPPE